MLNREGYCTIAQHAQHLLSIGENARASQFASLLTCQKSEDPEVQFVCSATLIDCGSAVKDIDLVKHGIKLIEELRESENCPSDVNYALLLYNLSNGYSEMADHEEAEGTQEAKLEILQKQKQALQSALLESKNIPKELLPNIFTNYANLLDYLGRTVEAVDYYYDCLEIDPEHATAMGNCGEAIQRLFNISPIHNQNILYEAWQLLKAANKREQCLANVSGHHALSLYRERLNQIEAHIKSQTPGDCNDFESYMTEFIEAHKSEPPKLAQQMKQDRLLLTVSPYLSNCSLEHKDDVFFASIVFPIGESQQRFNPIAHALNHIKEDFVTARYLYYQSQSQDPNIVETSAMTSYADTLDYADFGLRSGFLKASLRLAADMFDKCAGFLNLYLNLGHPEDRVILNNVWYTNRQYRKGLHTEITKLMTGNQYLAALYDVNRDLYAGKYPAEFRLIRNDATHKRLVLSWYGSLDRSDSSYDLNDFQKSVHSLLRMAKAAVIYLVGIVMVEEQRRRAEREDSGDGLKVAPGLSFRVGRGLSDKESQAQ